MNKIVYILIFHFCFTNATGQDVKMVSHFGTESQELQDLLYFEKTDLYNVKFIGTNLAKKDYVLICKEMWDGALKRTDTILNSAEFTETPKHQSDTLSFKVFAKRTGDPKLRLWFRFPGFGIERAYDAINSDDYSLRDVGTSQSIEYGKDFYAFAYILPYEKDGLKFWCAVDNSGKDVQNWGKEFGIKHYLIIEMKFE